MIGDEGGKVIITVGPQRAGINKEVVTVSNDDRTDLCTRTSDMLNFSGIGLNCKAVS